VSSGPTRSESPGGIYARPTRRVPLSPRTLISTEGAGGRAARRSPPSQVSDPNDDARREAAGSQGWSHLASGGGHFRGGGLWPPFFDSPRGDGARAANRRPAASLETRGARRSRRRDRHEQTPPAAIRLRLICCSLLFPHKQISTEGAGGRARRCGRMRHREWAAGCLSGPVGDISRVTSCASPYLRTAIVESRRYSQICCCEHSEAEERGRH